MWVAPTNRGSAPQQVGDVEGDMPHFGPPGEIVFHSIEGNSTFAFRVREDGTGERKVSPIQISQVTGTSPDGQIVIVSTRVDRRKPFMGTSALLTSGGPPIQIIDALCFLRWQADGKVLYLSVGTGMNTAFATGHTYVIPLSKGKMSPEIPTGGFHSEAEIAAMPGVHRLEVGDIAPGPSPLTYAFSLQTAQRNLYRIPLP